MAIRQRRASTSGVVSDAPALACTETRGTKIKMRLVATTYGPALLATSPPGDPRLFVVEQQGRIRILTNDGMLPAPFLDISEEIACCGEQGLLGLAFHPAYATNGQLFVFYTTSDKNIVARYQVSGDDPDRADPAGTVVLAIDDFATNHNGGMIDFGPDGHLYVGTGDGGGGGDPRNVGQDPYALLGKMLRIDVDNKLPGKEYGIPAENPFANGVAGAPEVFMLGLRNPWRWSFDRATGDLWIGDVGQDEKEELTYVPRAQQPGANLGWRMYEGTSCYDGPCNPASVLAPQYERTHADGWCSIIGGAVYRGSCYPDLYGTYLFTDYCAHQLVSARVGMGQLVFDTPEVRHVNGTERVADFPGTPSSLHADSRGELYLTATSCCGTDLLGSVYQLEVE